MASGGSDIRCTSVREEGDADGFHCARKRWSGVAGSSNADTGESTNGAAKSEGLADLGALGPE